MSLPAGLSKLALTFDLYSHHEMSLPAGLSKLALTFDLYGHHEMSLGSEERRGVIRYAQSRLPQFLTQLQR